MWCCLLLKSTSSHVSNSKELYIDHMIEKKASMLNNNYSLAFTIY